MLKDIVELLNGFNPSSMSWFNSFLGLDELEGLVVTVDDELFGYKVMLLIFESFD